MRTEWHRYNLKRRVAQLPSILLDVFAEKVLELQRQIDEEGQNEDEFGFYVNHRRKAGGERQLTKKDLKNIARLEAKRGRHPETGVLLSGRAASPATSVASELSEFSLGESIHYSEVDSNIDTSSDYNYSDSTHSDWDSLHGSDDEDSLPSDDEDFLDELAFEILPNTYCFYCGKNNEEVENNIRHMSHRHGLYIPERTYLVDLDGLLTFLNEVVTLDHECLVCGFLGKSLESIRQHIQSKGHCTIPYDSKEERAIVAEFYNFDVDTKPKALTSSKKVSFREVPNTEYVDVIAENDGDVEYPKDTSGQLDATEVEMTLPTGSRVGHRSMVRYYRQHLPVPREFPELNRTVALVDRRFAPGLTNTQVTRQEKDMRRLEAKARNVHERKTKSRRANYQAHFRDEILGT